MLEIVSHQDLQWLDICWCTRVTQSLHSLRDSIRNQKQISSGRRYPELSVREGMVVERNEHEVRWFVGLWDKNDGILPKYLTAWYIVCIISQRYCAICLYFQGITAICYNN
mgnify:CR=1 FL=1